jgi:hypothetical protein
VPEKHFLLIVFACEFHDLSTPTGTNASKCDNPLEGELSYADFSARTTFSLHPKIAGLQRLFNHS